MTLEKTEKQPKVLESLRTGGNRFQKLVPFLQRFNAITWQSIYPSDQKDTTLGQRGGFLLHMMNSPSGSTVFFALL